ncbi:hypothetical protein [Mariprofundus sp. KV]|uniref:hypothetical protein n=1 Tax=Mariprofundus sp. KV TaxID=2608715 RepID=UPI0015A46B36|nr:hypothetical protein [Mariprofundus sp. KV]NWF35378.1 hypothetical protein [Mariprofundus sp. KV]
MNQIKKLSIATSLIVLLISTSSCTTASNRKPLEIMPYTEKLKSTDITNIKLVFTEVVSGKPFNETVWDNKVGAFWDVKESNQIGYTQDYSKFIPVAVAGGLVGGVVGGTIAASSAGKDGLIDTRIVIPFGKIISTTFESALKTNSISHSSCYVSTCTSEASSQDVLSIHIDELYLWEEPLNHINLVIKGKSTYSSKGEIVTQYSFEKSMLAQRLAKVTSTSTALIKEMNRLSNVLAQEISTMIIINSLNGGDQISRINTNNTNN